MKIKSITILSPIYPSFSCPAQGSFVQSTVSALAEHWDITLISPVSPMRWAKNFRNDKTAESTPNVAVHRPLYFSASDKNILGFHTIRASLTMFERSAKKAFRKAGRTDAVYGHFLMPAGAAAISIGNEAGIPSFIAVGESDVGYHQQRYGFERIQAVVKSATGIVCMSEVNRKFLIDNYLVDETRTIVLHNAADPTKFYPADRSLARHRLGLPESANIALFVGRFDDFKGPLRLLEAARGIDDLSLVFLGAGTQRPMGPNVLFAGEVSHDQVPDWMVASNFLVAPTRAEGSSNTITEAMSIGLPVLCSDIPAVRETVGDSALLFAPDDVKLLRTHLRSLIGDESLVSELRIRALNLSDGNTLERRVRTMKQWMDSLVESA